MATTTTTQRTWTCTGCAAAREAARCPAGWKTPGGALLCGDCVRRRYIPRAIALPVAGPVDAEWADVAAALKLAWEESTALANWAMQRLLQADVVRMPGQGPKDCPGPPKINLYTVGIARGEYPCHANWAGATGSASSVLRKAQDHYAKHRYAVVWTRKEQPCHFDYPFPWPVRRQEWRALLLEGARNDMAVSVTLPGTRLTLRLRGGPEFARQVRTFRQIVAGEIEAGEMTLYRQRCSQGCHRRTVSERENGGAGRTRYREMVKICVWLPRPDPGQREGSLLLRTDPEAFWVAEIPGRMMRPWILNADQVRQWVVGHDRYRQRTGEDLKYEKRWPARKRRRINKGRERACDKNARRLDSWCKEAAALLANYARRQKVGEVVYDDSVRSYVPHFPWHKLAGALGNKLDEYGIALVGRAPEEAAVGASVDE